MRRIMLLLTITALMTVMLAVSAGTASAAQFKLGKQFGGNGATNIKLGGAHLVLTPSNNFHFNFR